MNPVKKRTHLGKHSATLSADFLLRAAIATASLFGASMTFAAEEQPVQDDYFHTGAGSHYLQRADNEIITHTLRDNISVLEGSGGNIVVLSGKEGKFLVDAGISKSRDKVKAALMKISPAPVKYVVNTHWHWDHTDGNAWMHEAGATIVAQVNTLKHLSQTTHVDDWNWTFQPVPAGARPTVLVQDEKTFTFAGSNIKVEHFGPGHSDGDLEIYFEKADVLAMGDTFWNAGYPFIDNQDGGSIDAAISWASKAIERTTDHTVVIPGHGPVGTRAQLIAFRDMLAGVRDNVRQLKQQGKSLDEVIAAKPSAAFDEKWGNFVIKPDHFVKLVYAGL
ncbi:MBL fold metallo-hydrolase [Pseudomonas sp. NPDC086251]|jgi:glyoxylase-like metal-dependent hydrolase (beta-lactamase superfamily II)|uniref:MBL fold metallo-hydrolase n=1 Tax=Pseudomonas sp. NPDC086251 TaxID=3364431 RepID=UPI003835746A